MRRIARVGYVGFAAIFLIGVMIQVFLAGMVVVAGEMGWGPHGDLGHALGIPLIFMLIAMYVGKLEGSMKTWSWVLFGVYILQADVLIFMRVSLPTASALHPVLALVEFSVGWFLLKRSFTIVQAQDQLEMESKAKAETA